jgi:hypothetical protein
MTPQTATSALTARMAAGLIKEATGEESFRAVSLKEV